MGRQPIGAVAKREMISVRVTTSEKIELTKRFGTPGKGIRAFIDTVMQAAREEGKK